VTGVVAVVGATEAGLALTGASVGLLVPGGAALVLLGAGLLLMGRRKREIDGFEEADLA
jgi:hypothetical protein